MIVVVIVVGGVPVPVVDVIHMVTVRNGDVPAALTMSVFVAFVHAVLGVLALVGR